MMYRNLFKCYRFFVVSNFLILTAMIPVDCMNAEASRGFVILGAFCVPGIGAWLVLRKVWCLFDAALCTWIYFGWA